MHVTLVHNPTAGDADHSKERITAALRAAGHAVRYVSSRDGGLCESLEQPADLVLVAGGDGTVGKVVRALGRRDVPLSILPLGGSNNVALALGIDVDATPERHVAALSAGSCRRLDVGQVSLPHGARLFLESAGVGCLARMISGAPPDEDVTLREHTLRTAGRLQRLVERAPARQRRVIADGEDASGELVLAAVLNVPRIGPRIELAHAADPGDGLLDLLLVGERERDVLANYLSELASGRTVWLPLETRRVRRVRMEWRVPEGHVDDEVWPKAAERSDDDGEEPVMAEIELSRAALACSVALDGSE